MSGGSHEWTECVCSPVRASFWIRKFSSFVSRPSEDADVLRRMALHHPLEPVGGDLERMLPRRRMQLAVLPAHERLGQAVRVVDEVEAKRPLTQRLPSLETYSGFEVTLTIRFVSRIDVEVDLAADAAERAGRLRLLERAPHPAPSRNFS